MRWESMTEHDKLVELARRNNWSVTLTENDAIANKAADRTQYVYWRHSRGKLTYASDNRGAFVGRLPKQLEEKFS